LIPSSKIGSDSERSGDSICNLLGVVKAQFTANDSGSTWTWQHEDFDVTSIFVTRAYNCMNMHNACSYSSFLLLLSTYSTSQLPVGLYFCLNKSVDT